MFGTVRGGLPRPGDETGSPVVVCPEQRNLRTANPGLDGGGLHRAR